ncbi:MAG: DNA repair protein RecN [bacterium]|nr:DNA repair protein RecN [bacterium]
MLDRLEVSGLGIIDAVSLELSEGLVALTGETGAGKSLLVESLKLLAGGRAQTDLVRSGERRLTVDGWFTVVLDKSFRSLFESLGIEAETEVVIRREMTATGRTRCWVNNVPVTVASLQQLAPRLMAIHGQHEQYGLGDGTVQLRMIDEFAGHDDLLQQVAGAFSAWEEGNNFLQGLKERVAKRRDRLDTISFQLAEIGAVSPLANEDVTLTQRRQLLRHAVRLQELSSIACGRLVDEDGSIVEGLALAQRAVAEMIELGAPLDGCSKLLEEAQVSLDESIRDIQASVGEMREDPAELEEIEVRLHRIEQLMLKYGSPLERVLEHRESLNEERAELEQIEEDLSEAERIVGDALEAYGVAAQRLDGARREAAEQLTQEVSTVLGELEMGGTLLQFEWSVRPEPKGPLAWGSETVSPTQNGIGECELLIAANPGETPRPMARIASGGELSRLHLALRTVLRGARKSAGLTLLFDEIDNGLGGQTAASLASLLTTLTSQDQVLVVTHLPQVAARAGGHLRVEKVASDGRAVTRVVPLNEDERINEIARMLSGGDVGESALRHAEALLGES